MTEATLKMAISVPHYNDIVRLHRCLTELMKNDTVGCEIVVVDNGSTQSLDAVQEEFPFVRFLKEPEKGASAACKTGVRQTMAPVSCIY